MKYAREDLVTERTLLGAVDSFLKAAVHVRPQFVSRFEAISEAWIDAWFEAGGENRLEAVDSDWLDHYLAQMDEGREEAEHFFRSFYLWAVRENLLDSPPLESSPPK